MRATGIAAVAVVAAWIAAAAAASAQPGPVRATTLRSALAAAGRSVQVRASALRTVAAHADVGAATGWPSPSVSVGTTSATARVIVTASIPLPIFGTIGTRGDVARAEVQTARAEQSATALDLRRRVAGAWLDLAASERRALSLDAAATREEAIAESVRRRLDAGDAPRAELVAANAAAARSRGAARAARAAVGAASATLAGLLGWRPTDRLAAAGELPAPGAPPPLATLIARGRAHPALRVAEARARTSGARVADAERARWPEVSLDGEADIEDPTLPGTDFRAAISVGLPIFSGGGDAVRAAAARQQAAELDLAATRMAASADIVAAYRRWESATLEADALAESVLPAQRESAELSRRAYVEGAGTLVAVLEAERLLGEVEVAEIEARVAAIGARWDLGIAVGEAP